MNRPTKADVVKALNGLLPINNNRSGLYYVAAITGFILNKNGINYCVLRATGLRSRKTFFGVNVGDNGNFTAYVIKLSFGLNIGRSKCADALVAVVNKENVKAVQKKTGTVACLQAAYIATVIG